jgi:hypothetical protein
MHMAGARTERMAAALALAAAVILPFAGALLAGLPAAPYLEFPPRTRHVQHAAFSWRAFGGLAAALTLVLAPFLRRVGGGPVRRVPAAARFPWWGWAGLAAGAASWTLAWSRFEWFAPLQPFTFSPLWFAYILVVNALTLRRTGVCMLTTRPRLLLALFACSAAFWWYFEYLNRFVQNWRYVGIADLPAWKYFLFATLPFSTVLPAVLGTYELLASFPRLGRRWNEFAPWRPGRRARALPALVLAAAAATLAGIGVRPDLLFPLVWISPLAVITALQALAGRPTIFAPLAQGRWRHIGLLALAALICGFFWEMWNWHSLAKWVYQVPYVQKFHLFEMPILGYAGYLPFGLECAVIAQWVGWKVSDAECAMRGREGTG